LTESGVVTTSFKILPNLKCVATLPSKIYQCLKKQKLETRRYLYCNLLPRFDSDPCPRSPLHRGGYHLVDRMGSGRYPQKTNPAQWKANFQSAVSGSYRAEDCRQTNVRSQRNSTASCCY